MEPTSLTGAQTLHPNSEKNTFPQPDYSEAKKKYILFRRQRMIASRDIRDTTHDEFDGMGFLKWYDTMKKIDDQYVAPRKNKQDTSINMGTARDKDTSLVEYASKYDFEPVAQVYDDSDEMLEEMAETGEELVKKSKLLEMYKDKAKLTYRAMVAFGVAMVEDAWVERWVLEKTIKQGWKPSLGSSSVQWEERLIKQMDGCVAKLWDLRKCYFGDIRKYFMNGPMGQPYFFTVEYESYDSVKAIFQNWDMWKYVPTTIVYTPEVSQATVYNSSWTLRPVSMNYCEIVRYYDPLTNEFAITINGIDMLPIMEKEISTEDGQKKTYISGFPLKEISPSGAIPFAKFDFEPMHDFVYSKPQTAKMRVLADVENMFIKLMIGMMKQKAKPTLGNKSGRMFGEEATDPGTVINDIREGDLFPILPNFTGASASDFSMYKLVQGAIARNSVEDSFQGIDGSDQDPKNKTATEDMNDLKSQSLKVASMFDGIISGENQLNWLRTYNIAKNWTKPIDQEIDVFRKTIIDKYRTVTLPTEINGGQKAMKRIIFTKTPPKGKTDLERSQAVHQEEMDHVKDNGGKELRITYLHPEQFAMMKMNWFYTCVPIPNGADPLAYMLFGKQIQDAIAMFGPESLNVKKLKHKFAAKTGEDFDTWFLGEQELQQKQQEAAQQQGQNDQVPGKTPIKTGTPQGTPPVNKMASVMR
jgi:hypothetical protein